MVCMLFKKIFEFSLDQSFDSLMILLQTIREYREFANPNESDWFEYISQFFQVLGFNKVKIAQRLIALQSLGSKQKPKALVCIIQPKEDMFF